MVSRGYSKSMNEALRGVGFECVEQECDERVTIEDTESGRGVIIVYESFFPPYADVYAWCRDHVPDRSDAELKEDIKSGVIEWSPSVREEGEWPA